jgi:hypothetical protein
MCDTCGLAMVEAYGGSEPSPTPHRLCVQDTRRFFLQSPVFRWRDGFVWGVGYRFWGRPCARPPGSRMNKAADSRNQRGST